MNSNKNLDLSSEESETLSLKIVLPLGLLFGFLGGLLKFIGISFANSTDSLLWFGPAVACVYVPLLSPFLGLMTSLILWRILNMAKSSRKYRFILIILLAFLIGAIPLYFFPGY